MDSIAEKTVCMLYKLTIQHSFKNSQINSLNKHFNLNNQYKQSMKKIPILLSKTGTFIKQIPCQPWIKQYLSQGRWTHTIKTQIWQEEHSRFCPRYSGSYYMTSLVLKNALQLHVPITFYLCWLVFHFPFLFLGLLLPMSSLLHQILSPESLTVQMLNSPLSQQSSSFITNYSVCISNIIHQCVHK